MSDAMFHQHAVSAAQAVSRPGLLVDPTRHDQTKLLLLPHESRRYGDIPTTIALVPILRI